MSLIEYNVDTNEYFQGFVESTSMEPCDAVKELQQNIKHGYNLKMNLVFLNSDLKMIKTEKLSKKGEYFIPSKMIKIEKLSKKGEYFIPSIDTIIIDDKSSQPMTIQNAKDMMTSLMRTRKSGGIGCFNFGEILSMYVLTNNGNGEVLYHNKETGDSWLLQFNINKCPVLTFELKDKENKLIEDIKNKYSSENGTLKIIKPKELAEFNYRSTMYEGICDFIDISMNDKEFNKWVFNPDIDELFKSDYKFRHKVKYYIELSDNLQVNITKRCDSKYYIVDNISCVAKPKSDSKSFKECNKSVSKRRIKSSSYVLTIKTIILPHEYYNNESFKNYENIYYNVEGFNLNIKDKNKVIKLIYPNSGGNMALKKTYTIISLKCFKPELDDKNSWIKKKIFNFYPDKLKTGDPIENWHYIKNYIKHDMEMFYSHITSDNVTGISDCFAVRNNYCPSTDNKMWRYEPEKNENGKIESKYIPMDVEPPDPIDESTDDENMSDDDEIENDIELKIQEMKGFLIERINEETKLDKLNAIHTFLTK